MLDSLVYRRKSAISNFKAQATVIILTTLPSIVVIPFAIKCLGSSVYGAWISIGELFAYGAAFKGFSDPFVQRMSQAHSRKNNDSIGEYFLLLVVSSAIFCIISALAITPVIFNLLAKMGLGPIHVREIQFAFILTILTALLLILAGTIQYLLMSVQQPYLINRHFTITRVVAPLLIILFLLFTQKVYSFALGHLVSSAFFFVAALYCYHLFKRGMPNFKLRWSKEKALEMLKVLPLSAGTAFVNFFFLSSSIFVAAVISPVAALSFKLSQKILEMAQIIFSSFTEAIGSGFAHKRSLGQEHETYAVTREIRSISLTVCMLVVIFYVMFNEFFVGIVANSSLYGGNTMTILFAISFLVVTQFNLAGTFYRFSGFINESSFIMILEFLVRIGVSLILLPRFGILSMPLVQFITSLIGFLIISKLLNKSFKQIKIKKTDKVGAALIVNITTIVTCILCHYFFSSYHLSFLIVLSLIIVVLFLHQQIRWNQNFSDYKNQFISMMKSRKKGLASQS